MFPDRWKVSQVTPTFRCGSRGQAGNYRGVAILPTVGKLYEKIICDMLSDHFRSYIFRFQHGFMRARSIRTNLVELAQVSM